MATKLTDEQIRLRVRAHAYEYHAEHGLPERREYWQKAAADVWAKFYAAALKVQTSEVRRVAA